jgi:transposase
MDSLTLTAWQRRRLERQLKTTPDARLYRRTLAVLEVARGKPVAEVARALGVTPRGVYYWVDAYAQDHDPTALRDNPRPGRPRLWPGGHRDPLRELLGQSPQDLGYAAVDWTVPLLQAHLEQRLGQRLCDDTIRRELQRRRYVWKRSRYVLDPDPELEKKTADPLPDRAAAAPDRPPGRGRDRPAALPATAGRLGAQG